MRRLILVSGLSVLMLLALLWATGVLAALAAWAAGEQRAVQSALAQGIRAIRAGDPGAWGALLSVCFAYGFIHAVGPGHGKVLVAGYGVARRVPVVRLSVLALVSSLAQALTAIVIVGIAVMALGWTRERVESFSDGVIVPFGHLMVAALGLWLVWRGFAGLRALAVQGGGPRGHGHVHDHGHHHHAHHVDDHVHGPGCGHAHGPTVEEALAVSTWKDAGLLVAGIAARPCAGALFLLILTGAMGIFHAGIAGALAMGLGTASVTITVAVLAVWSREGAFAALSDAWMARALPGVEIAAGAIIAAVAIQLYLSGI
jgi:ABC-type nickel/cobalt efflux system permease component RcnA